jgi:hypothetical protein
MDERRRGEMGMGWQPVFVLKSGSVARAEREKGWGSVWRRRGGPCRGGRQRGAASNGPRPSSDTVTRAKVADEGDQGEAGLGGRGRGAGESGKESPGGDGALTGRPGQQSGGAAVQTVF